jgi:hypothetical protein
MGIKQIDERTGGIMLPSLGKFHQGDVRPERGPGKDLGEEFRFAASPEYQRAQVAFQAIYGDRPTEFRAFLPFARLADNWDYWYESWGGSRLKYRCDGQNWVKWLAPDGKSYSREPRACPYCTQGKPAPQGEHKVYGRLALVVPDLIRTVGVVGTITLQTTSVTDVYALNTCFRAIQAQDLGGRDDWRGIELVVRRVAREVPTKEHGIRKLWVVEAQPVVEWVMAQMAAARSAALGGVPAGVDALTGEVEVPADGEERECPPPIGAPEPSVPWHQDPVQQQALKALVRELGLLSAEVAAALEVEKVSEYPGEYEDVVEVLREYAAHKNNGGGQSAAWNAQRGETRKAIMAFARDAATCRDLPAPSYQQVKAWLKVAHLGDYQEAYLKAQHTILETLDSMVSQPSAPEQEADEGEMEAF